VLAEELGCKARPNCWLRKNGKDFEKKEGFKGRDTVKKKINQ